MGQALSGPSAQQVQCKRSTDKRARRMTMLQQNCLQTLKVSTSYQSLLSKNVLLLIFFQSLKKKKKNFPIWSPHRHRLPNFTREPRSVMSEKKNDPSSCHCLPNGGCHPCGYTQQTIGCSIQSDTVTRRNHRCAQNTGERWQASQAVSAGHSSYCAHSWICRYSLRRI